jgi:hypothetical protein
MNIFRSILVLTIILFTSSFNLFAQQYEHETSTNIPELSDFHEVIYPIWHEAYPEKNYNLLKDFSDSVKTMGEKIFTAKLPGILRDKEAKWNEAVAKFKSSVEEYSKASEGNDDSKLLLAAEELHTRYEGLVRTIRPVAKEVDEFHKDLYVIYHHYLPGNDLEKVKKMAGGLKEKAHLLTGVKLSSRLADKQERYNKAVDELIKTTDTFVESLEKTDTEVINQALDKMHTSYQKLEAVFD